MKHYIGDPCYVFNVASRVEAWIETHDNRIVSRFTAVASRVEAWIETNGLFLFIKNKGVASRVEAWIETFRILSTWTPVRRLPRGGVD